MPQINVILLPLCFASVFPAAVLAQDIQIESQVPGIAAKTLTELPVNPTPIEADDYCIASVWGDAQTAEGKQAADAGWGVVGEYTDGPVTYVAFVAEAVPGTSGSCLLERGNFGIFQAGKIVGILYGDSDKTYAIGRANTLENGDLRIFDGDYLSAPVGDLNHDGKGKFVLGPVAARDTFCGGEVSVPTLYGQPIRSARQTLLDEGWSPSSADAETRAGWGDFMTAMAENGLEEVQDCAGTGFGYCNFQYSQEGGRTLELTTIGEDGQEPGLTIVGYQARCE